jgi:hypothetical protein
MAAVSQRSALNDSQLQAVLAAMLVDLTAIRTAVVTNASLLNAYTVAGTGFATVAALTTT